ncbi:DNA repair protein RecO [Thioalkalivibrio sp. XN8]|uniref:DNA repair protein RecO n=1 Tax=Thioalkalivibrio sp. XN8 TaxID=2712863 RepID=UPI003211E739
MLRVELEPGFILHHRPFRDTSLLLEVLSQAHGRVGLVARGARGSRSRLRPLLQPFRPLLLSWQLRGELGTLTAAEPDGAARPLPAGEALLALYYVNELLLRLTARLDPHAGLFPGYAATLEALRAPGSPAPALRRFEKLLLDVLGYGPDLGFDQAGQPVTGAQCYRYHPAGGLTPCAADAEGALLGTSLHALATGELADARALADARRLLRAALDVHLDGRPLKTRELLRQFRG